MKDSPIVAERPDVVDPVVRQSNLNIHNRITQRTIPKRRAAAYAGRIRRLDSSGFGQLVRYGTLLHNSMDVKLSLVMISFSVKNDE